MSLQTTIGTMRARSVRVARVSCTAATSQVARVASASQEASLGLSRRATLLSLVGALVTPGIASAALPAQVGQYLPPAGIEDFVLFVPDSKKTPAIRAGTVDPSKPYRFALPPTWRESKVANIQSGNYCQPRCAEPWTEVIFENSQEGKAQVIVSPLVRLVNKPDTPIDQIGSPDAVLARVGEFITGTYLDEEDVVSAESKKLDDGRTYYYYEVNASYGSNGPHTLTACTTKGELAYLFVVSANDKQWAKEQGKLRELVSSFRA